MSRPALAWVRFCVFQDCLRRACDDAFSSYRGWLAGGCTRLCKLSTVTRWFAAHCRRSSRRGVQGDRCFGAGPSHAGGLHHEQRDRGHHCAGCDAGYRATCRGDGRERRDDCAGDSSHFMLSTAKFHCNDLEAHQSLTTMCADGSPLVTLQGRTAQRSFAASAAHEDVVVGSARAYVNALNKLMEFVQTQQQIAEPVRQAVSVH